VDGPTIGSLCSGYEGLGIAAMSVLGGRVMWHCEYDPTPDKDTGLPRPEPQSAQRILAHHWPGVPNHGNIATVDWATVEPVDMLVMGWPCQPWSDAGLRGGTADARDLWPAVASAVCALRPRLAFMEQVPGFARRPAGFGRTADDLAAIGYDLRWTRLRAADVGAPHVRERWFAVAWPAADTTGPGR
jgi:DNA (cytosine-5)-methyltransferase 1